MVEVSKLYFELKKILLDVTEDAGFELEQIIQHVTGFSRFAQYKITKIQAEEIERITNLRVDRIPLQYLLGEWEFFSLRLFVGEGVLIPRADTEQLCIEALALLNKKSEPAILDLCSGTGAVALALQSKRPKAKIIAVEYFAKAFAFLQKNISLYKDLFETVPKAVLADALTYSKEIDWQSIDMVVCNPPYVTEQEYTQLTPEIYHEPKTALVAQDDGLLFYKKISKEYYSALNMGGNIVFEIGAGQGKQVGTILENTGYSNIVIKQDLAGRDRVVVASKF